VLERPGLPFHQASLGGCSRSCRARATFHLPLLTQPSHKRFRLRRPARVVRIGNIKADKGTVAMFHQMSSASAWCRLRRPAGASR
jgi:hypothetical protein